MTERITSMMVANSTVNTINQDLNQLDNTQEQLATGFRINQPSDDPYGASLTLSLNGQISAYSSYQTNVTQGSAWTGTASSALQEIQQIVNTVRTLTVEGANGTASQTDLQDSAQEVAQYIGEVKQAADTQYDGSYIFAGDSVNTEPWSTSTDAGTDTYAGNENTISYAIGPSTQLQISANLYSVLGSGDAGGTAGTSSNGGGALQADGSGGLLATLRTIYADMEDGNQTDLGNQLNNLDQNKNALEAVQATVGSTQDRLQMASSRLTSLTSTDTIELGDVQDTDVAAATTAFATEQAGYQAALQSTADIIQMSLMNFLQS